MGYDMYRVDGPTDEEALATKLANEQFSAAVNARDSLEKGTANYEAAQVLVDQRYHELHTAEASYFRLNVWGMGVAREELAAVGVISPAPDPASEWPKPEDYGLAEWPDDYEKEWSPDSPEGRFLADNKRHLAEQPPGDTVGIGMWKLCSNDGWIVTPGEIRTGLAWADKYHEGWRDGLHEYVQRFVEWMTLAAAVGGFRVS